jgi:hypothetical protein
MDLLSNFTVYLHDSDGATSKQVEVLNGAIVQSSGSWCPLNASSPSYISLAVKKRPSDTCNAALKLHIVKDGTSSPEFIQTILINLK